MSIDLLEKIYTKVEKISEDVNELKVIQAQQSGDLRVYVQKQEEIEQDIISIKADLVPLKERVVHQNAMMKILAGLLAVISTVAGILQINRH